MGITNRMVALVLRSPAHRVLSGATDLIRYSGRRSGREITTPTQYARVGDTVVILAGRPHTKQWWRNFREPRDIDVLVRGAWLPMTGRVVAGTDEPDLAASLLTSYLARFPRAGRALDGDTLEEQARHAVIVWCQPR